MVSYLQWRLYLFCPLTFFFVFRSILHDPKTYPNPMDFQPERYLKDGELDVNAMDAEAITFGFGRRSVYSNIVWHLHKQNIFPSPEFVQEDTWPAPRYTWLQPVFLHSTISNHQLMIRAIPSKSNPKLPMEICRKNALHVKYIQSAGY